MDGEPLIETVPVTLRLEDKDGLSVGLCDLEVVPHELGDSVTVGESDGVVEPHELTLALDEGDSVGVGESDGDKLGESEGLIVELCDGVRLDDCVAQRVALGDPDWLAVPETESDGLALVEPVAFSTPTVGDIDVLVVCVELTVPLGLDGSESVPLGGGVPDIDDVLQTDGVGVRLPLADTLRVPHVLADTLAVPHALTDSEGDADREPVPQADADALAFAEREGLPVPLDDMLSVRLADGHAEGLTERLVEPHALALVVPHALMLVDAFELADCETEAAGVPEPQPDADALAFAEREGLPVPLDDRLIVRDDDVLPEPHADALIERDASGEPLGVAAGVAETVCVSEPLPVPDPEGVAVGEREPEGVAVDTAEPERVSLGVALGVATPGDAVAEGVGAALGEPLGESRGDAQHLGQFARSEEGRVAWPLQMPGRLVLGVLCPTRPLHGVGVAVVDDGRREFGRLIDVGAARDEEGLQQAFPGGVEVDPARHVAHGHRDRAVGR